MKDIIGNLLKNSAYATLPQGTMSLAGMMGLGNQSTFSQNLPIAAKMMYEGQQAQQKQAERSLQQQALMQYAQANGNQGLVGLLQTGVRPDLALKAHEVLNPPKYDNLIKAGDTVYDPYTDAGGNTQLRSLTNDNNANARSLNRKLSPSEKVANDRILRENTKSLDAADTFLEALDKAEKYATDYQKYAPWGAKSGDYLTRNYPEKARLLGGNKARSAYDELDKTSKDLILKYGKNFEGAGRLKIVGEAVAGSIANKDQTYDAQLEVIRGHRKTVNRNKFVANVVKEWNKYAPSDLASAESLASDLLENYDFIDETGRLKSKIPYEKLVKEQIDKYYGTNLTPQETEEVVYEDVQPAQGGNPYTEQSTIDIMNFVKMSQPYLK